MIISIIAIVFVNLIFSVENLLALVLIANSIKSKREKISSISIGLLISAIFKIVIVLSLLIFIKQNPIIYFLAGIFLLFVSFENIILKKEEHAHKIYKKENIVKIIGYIIFIDAILSFDSVIATISLSVVPAEIIIGILISLILILIIIFFIHDFLKHINGLNIIAYLPVAFIGIKFILLSIGVIIDDTFTTIIIAILFIIPFLIFNKNIYKDLIKN